MAHYLCSAKQPRNCLAVDIYATRGRKCHVPAQEICLWPGIMSECWHSLTQSSLSPRPEEDDHIPRKYSRISPQAESAEGRRIQDRWRPSCGGGTSWGTVPSGESCPSTWRPLTPWPPESWPGNSPTTIPAPCKVCVSPNLHPPLDFLALGRIVLGCNCW